MYIQLYVFNISTAKLLNGIKQQYWRRLHVKIDIGNTLTSKLYTKY